jgi:hypothetical protein
MDLASLKWGNSWFDRPAPSTSFRRSPNAPAVLARRATRAVTGSIRHSMDSTAIDLVSRINETAAAEAAE